MSWWSEGMCALFMHLVLGTKDGREGWVDSGPRASEAIQWPRDLGHWVASEAQGPESIFRQPLVAHTTLQKKKGLVCSDITYSIMFKFHTNVRYNIHSKQKVSWRSKIQNIVEMLQLNFLYSGTLECDHPDNLNLTTFCPSQRWSNYQGSIVFPFLHYRRTLFNFWKVSGINLLFWALYIGIEPVFRVFGFRFRVGFGFKVPGFDHHWFSFPFVDFQQFSLTCLTKQGFALEKKKKKNRLLFSAQLMFA